MKNVVRETLQVRIPALGKDQSKGPVPSRTMEKQSETNIPLPHHAMTLSMCSRNIEGHSMESNGAQSRAQEDEDQNQLRRAPAPLLRKPPKTVSTRILISRQIDQFPI